MCNGSLVIGEVALKRLIPSFPNPLNSGAAVDLDDCGGHTHDAYGYHYHSQLVSMQDSQGAFTSYVSGT